MKTTQLTFQTDFKQLNAQYAFFKFTAQHNKGKVKDSAKDAAVWYAGMQLDNLLDEQVILASLTPAVKNGEKHLVDYVKQPDDKSPENPRR